MVSPWLCDTENVKFTLALKTVYNIVNIGWRRYEVVSIETGNFAILKNQDVEIKGEIKTARATRLVTSMEAKCTFPASFSRYSIKGKQIERYTDYITNGLYPFMFHNATCFRDMIKTIYITCTHRLNILHWIQHILPLEIEYWRTHI